VTDVKGTEMEKGLRILARMIARAYLRDMSRKQSEPIDSQDKGKENNNGDKRRV
jgi:hypothetical protein